MLELVNHCCNICCSFALLNNTISRPNSELCSPAWCSMLLKLLQGHDDTASGNCARKFLTVQLQIIGLLQVLLPHWDRHAEEQKHILDQLIDLLTEHVLLVKPDPVLEAAYGQTGDGTTPQGRIFTQEY